MHLLEEYLRLSKVFSSERRAGGRAGGRLRCTGAPAGAAGWAVLPAGPRWQHPRLPACRWTCLASTNASSARPTHTRLLFARHPPPPPGAAAMKGMKLPKGLKGDINPRNMQQSIAQMSRMLPPHMLKMMGGPAAIQSLVGARGRGSGLGARAPRASLPLLRHARPEARIRRHSRPQPPSMLAGQTNGGQAVRGGAPAGPPPPRPWPPLPPRCAARPARPPRVGGFQRCQPLAQRCLPAAACGPRPTVCSPPACTAFSPGTLLACLSRCAPPRCPLLPLDRSLHAPCCLAPN